MKEVEDYKGILIDSKKAVLIINTGDKKLYGSVDDPKIQLDFLSGGYIHVDGGQVMQAYSEINDENAFDKLIYAYVKTTKQGAEFLSNIVEVIDGRKTVHYCGDFNHLLSKGYKENYNNGRFYKKTSKANVPMSNYVKFKHPKIESTADMFKFGAISPTNMISERKPYTFGIEIETYKGIIPPHVRKNLNIDSQYDGSVRDENGKKDTGGEYTTGVLYGDNGFKHLYEIMTEISRRCLINNTCSVHVHLGNIIFNKETIVLLYKIYQMIENELFSMMPPSRLHRAHCSHMTKKNFTLTNRGIPYEVLIDQYYRDIFKMMSLGEPASAKTNKEFNHPRGKTCGWDQSTPRYWWVNFVPALFNVKGKDNYTIEVRNMHATLDFDIIKNWVLINMAIVSFVENNKRAIIEAKKLTLKQIIESEFSTKHEYLNDYIQSRKDLFKNIDNEMFVYEPKNNITKPIENISIKKVIME